MELGNFSLSLAVKDIEASRAFYEKLGFTAFGGGADQGHGPDRECGKRLHHYTPIDDVTVKSDNRNRAGVAMGVARQTG